MRTPFPVVLTCALAGSLGLLAGAQQKPAFDRAPDALERVTWRTRTLVSDDRLTNWNFAITGGGLTFLETVLRADAAVVTFVEASSTQAVGGGGTRTLDSALTVEEIASLKSRMGEVRLLTYRVEGAATRESVEKALQFAKDMGAETVVVPAGTPLEGLDAIADQAGVNVAVMADSARPSALLKGLAGKGKRLGIGIDTGLWAQEGVSAAEGLALVKERLLYVRLRDRSARGAGGRNVLPGQGVGDLKGLFLEMERLGIRPVSMTLDTAGVVSAPSDLFKAIDAFEAVVQPAYGINFTAFSKTRPIRWDVVMPAKGETPNPEALRKAGDEVRAQIGAAIPKQAYAAPKKRRKLLVVESLHGMSHNTIPHTNVMIEEMGRITGAWEAEFNNDLDNLKYPKIKGYDGVFLNSTVGELLPDPAVREGLARFVKEGGGLGGIHGTPWASRNWDEFAEMIGAQSAPHRIEQGVMKVYDAASPLMQPFGGKDLPFREEGPPLRTRRPGAAAVGQRARPADRRARRPEDRAAPVERLQASRQHLSCRVDSYLRQGTRLLQLARPHAGDVHDAGDRRALPGRLPVPARRSGRRHDPEPGGPGVRTVSSCRGRGGSVDKIERDG